MGYLIDTNVVCELTRIKPNKGVIHWFQEVPSELLFLSVLTLGEIRKGVEKIAENTRQEKLRTWLEYELPNWFDDRILMINQHVADRWGRLQSEVSSALPAIDSLLAATALHYDLCMVTRNERDFQHGHLKVFNPFN